MNPGEDQQSLQKCLVLKIYAFTNSALVFSLMNLFLTEADLYSVVVVINVVINISNKECINAHRVSHHLNSSLSALEDSRSSVNFVSYFQFLS